MALPTFKFYRISINGTVGGSRAAIATISFYNDFAGITPVSTVGAIASASSELSATTYPAAKALDGTTNSSWLSQNNSVPAWWQIEFPAPETIYSLTLNGGNWWNERMTSFDILASNDGITWAILQVNTNVAHTTNTDYSYQVIPVVSNTIGITYDLTSVGTAVFTPQLVYDTNAPVIITPRLDVAYTVPVANNINALLNQSHAVAGTQIIRKRFINTWDIVPSGVFISGQLGISYDLNPSVASGVVNLPALTINARPADSGVVNLPSFTASGIGKSGNIASGTVSIPAFKVSARAAVTAAFTMPAITATGIATFINAGSGVVTIPAVAISVAPNNGTFGVGSGIIPRLGVSGTGIGGTFASGSVSIGLTVAGQGFIGQTASGVAALPAFTATATAIFSTTAAGSVFLPALRIDTGLRAVDGGAIFSGWALNMEGNLLTEYAGYPFNSMGTFNGRTLAATSAGIVELTGGLDGIYTIDAQATTSQADFDSHFMKRIRDAYVGLRADGGVIFKTITDENVIRQYPLSRVRNGLHEQRVKLSRGVKSRYWQFGIENVDGAFFELDNITIEPEVLTRRTR